MQTSTLGAVSPLPRRSIRRALPFTALLLVLAAAPVIAGPYDVEIARIRTDIEAKLDLITGQHDRISGFEEDLVALDHQMIDNDSAISSEDIELRVLPIRLELLADQFIQVLASRSEPAMLHQTMAIDAYLRNDERMNAVLTQSAQLAADSLDGIRDRMLYELSLIHI